MKKLQARDVPDDLYDRVAAAAARNSRSLEGQVRHTLTEAHPAVTISVSPVSLRETWQKDAGQRIRWLFDRLRDDGWYRFGEAADPASLARKIGETSPASLLDCLDGISGPTFDMADRMENALSCRADWIMSGSGAPFRCERLSGRYPEFFKSLLDEEGQLLPDTALHFVRICADDHSDGTLLVLVRRGQTWQCRYEHSRFFLKNGMGSGGRGNLLRFLVYVKTHLNKVPYKSWLYHNENETDPEISHHHPERFIQDLTLSEHSDWLYRMLNGEAPGGWTISFSWELEQLATLSTKAPLSKKKKGNLLHIQTGNVTTAELAAPGAIEDADIHGEKNADSDATEFVRRFLAFLAEKGVSCSDPILFTAKVCQFAPDEGILRSVRMIMQKRGGWHGDFILHNDTLAELPRFEECFPGELMDEFGFTADEARTVLHEIRPARDDLTH